MRERNGPTAFPRQNTPHRRAAAAGPFRHLGRSALLALVGGVLLTGCATKRDVQELRSEVAALSARQDSVLSLLQRQNRAILDTLDANNDLLVETRGDLGRQLLEMEEQLVQIQELTGQSQRRLSELRGQIEARSESLESAGVVEDAPDAPAAAGGSAEELFSIGMEQFQRGAGGTARRAFEQILQRYPTHQRAPDAQFYLAETYVLDEEYDRALEEFERVVQLFPGSARAAAALYRAGVVSQERGNVSRAREYFQRVVSGWPQSEEARLAGERLDRLRR